MTVKTSDYSYAALLALDTQMRKEKKEKQLEDLLIRKASPEFIWHHGTMLIKPEHGMVKLVDCS